MDPTFLLKRSAFSSLTYCVLTIFEVVKNTRRFPFATLNLVNASYLGSMLELHVGM